MAAHLAGGRRSAGAAGESLEELRMLSNFQAGGYPLLQIFLLGQPEFRLTLHDGKLEQLRQRVIAMHHLAPMDADEVEPYLIHRLSCVGWRGKPRFTNDAVVGDYRWSGGIPRRVNQLAGRVLLFGAIEQLDTFGAPELAAVIADLDNDTPAAPARTRPPIMRLIEPLELRDIAPMAMGTPTAVRAGRGAAAACRNRRRCPRRRRCSIDRAIAELEKQVQPAGRGAAPRADPAGRLGREGEGDRRPDLSGLRGHAA
jgi:general secretion pathway protein A